MEPEFYFKKGIALYDEGYWLTSSKDIQSIVEAHHNFVKCNKLLDMESPLKPKTLCFLALCNYKIGDTMTAYQIALMAKRNLSHVLANSLIEGVSGDMIGEERINDLIKTIQDKYPAGIPIDNIAIDENLIDLSQVSNHLTKGIQETSNFLYDHSNQYQSLPNNQEMQYASTVYQHIVQQLIQSHGEGMFTNIMKDIDSLVQQIENLYNEIGLYTFSVDLANAIDQEYRKIKHDQTVNYALKFMYFQHLYVALKNLQFKYSSSTPGLDAELNVLRDKLNLYSEIMAQKLDGCSFN